MKRYMNASNRSAEQQRQNANDSLVSEVRNGNISMLFGTIQSYNADNMTIKASDASGRSIANSTDIPLLTTPRKIAEEWGTVERGMRVLVLYSSIIGGSSAAFIVGEPGEKKGESPAFANDLKRGLYVIFSPGIGVG